MGRLIDCDGDHWIPDDGGWLCEEHPDCWLPDREKLDLIWGPLWEDD